MNGKFEIFQSSKNDQYYFRLKAAGNWEIILDSEGYTTKSSCQNGIESVKENSQHDERYERLEARNGEHYFNLKAGNGEIIGSSETYTRRQAMENGISSVMKNAPDAIIVDLTKDEPEEEKEFLIIINGQQKTVTSKKLSFEDIVLLAFSHIKPGDNTIYTMTYKKAVGNKPEGTLVAGEVIKIKSGVIINVTATDKS
ncbi:hypothetical protein A9267_16730 [Shewanella sp. UCD-FRSSP16_17]|uniref:multiubiquitin domain-containing protein n=1 Tax=Shewanella sp. UCD-FRSSP16_17 TaxID=1853256 RepID=UPI0007EEA407|nr:hypothetical protein A9267_16730 [Shewanella sp. UCD-FRSSP16_17]